GVMENRLPEMVQALLAQIREQPEDDLPRLVLADWLMEHGTSEAEQAHGEFLRLHILQQQSTNPAERFELNSRARQLQEAHGRDWLGELAQRIPGWEYRRGGVLGVEAKTPLGKLAALPRVVWAAGLQPLGA